VIFRYCQRHKSGPERADQYCVLHSAGAILHIGNGFSTAANWWETGGKLVKSASRQEEKVDD